jgi:hypothetical protein
VRRISNPTTTRAKTEFDLRQRRHRLGPQMNPTSNRKNTP